MFDRIRNLLGFNRNSSVEADSPTATEAFTDDTDGKLGLAYAEYDSLFAPRQKTSPQPQLSYAQIAWYRLIGVKHRVQNSIRSAFQTIFNGAFYAAAFNVALAFFARSVGFLATGSFGMAAITIVPAYIAFKSSGPIQNVISKFVSFTLPPIGSALLYVGKTLGSSFLKHCLRVTGVADYAMTVQPGKFFGEAKLPTFPLANRDNDVDPNPDTTVNAGFYGPDINVGPFSLGTSIRGNWSVIKYLPHAPQYIKYGLNWFMNKSGLEDFARGVETPLKLQAQNEAMSDKEQYKETLSDFSRHLSLIPTFTEKDLQEERHMMEFIASVAINGGMSEAQIADAVEKNLTARYAIEKYSETINKKINDVSAKVAAEINKYVREYRYSQNILPSQIEDAVKFAQIAPQKFIQAKSQIFHGVYSDNIQKVAVAAIAFEGNDVFSNPELRRTVDAGAIAMDQINTAFNKLSEHIENSSAIFISAFDRKIAEIDRANTSKKSKQQKKSAILTQFESKSAVPLKLLTKEEIEQKWQDKAAAKKKQDETMARWNNSPINRALLEEEENKKRMQEEDDERSRSHKQQLQIGPGGHKKTLKNE